MDKKTKLADQIEEVVKKDFNIPIPTTFSSPSSPPTSVVSTPNVSASSIMYWPAPKLWYQQGKEAAKKAYNEYLNATNQYLQAPPDQFERQMEMAGKMNSVAQSMVQGISIGTEALEDISRRVRTGDQAALIEQAVVSDTVMRLLKTVWVHNVAAKSGRNAGLEVKLLENQLVGRINRVAGLNASDEGIALLSNDDADTIWVEDINLAQPPVQEEGAVGGEVPPEEVPPEEVPPEEVPPEEVPPEEVPPEEIPAEGEEVPPEEMVEGEPPLPEGEMSDEELQELLAEIEAEEGGAGEEIPPEEVVEGEEIPPEEGEVVEEEVPPEEVVEGEEVPPEEGEVVEEEVPPEEVVEGEEVPPEEEVTEEEVQPEEEEGEGEEEDKVYCIVCDEYVSPEDIKACQEENCPFAEDKAKEEEKETPIKKEEKHYVILDVDDHTSCNVSRFTVKEFTGVKGEFCVTHNRAISYEFDQNQWTSEDAKAWVNKQTKLSKIKTKSSEEIVRETLDKIPSDVIEKWVEEQNVKKKEAVFPDEDIDIDEDGLKEILSTTITKAISEVDNRLSSLEGAFLKT